MIWHWKEFDLGEVRQWGAGSTLDLEHPTIFQYSFRNVPWTLLFCFARLNEQFQATLGNYPVFASRLAQLQEPLWKPEGIGVGAFLTDFNRAGFKRAEIPNVFPLPRQLLPKGFATAPVFRFSRFKAIPLVLPNSAVDGMVSYLERQVQQFGPRAFLPAAGPIEPLQWRSVIDGVVDTESALYPLVLAFGLPPNLLTTERLVQAREVLRDIVNGGQDKYPLQSVFRARPIFFRSDLRKVLVTDRTTDLSAELEEECNILRARMVAILCWPELYGEVKNFLCNDAPRWKAAKARGSFTASLVQELEDYAEKVEIKYPVLQECP